LNAAKARQNIDKDMHTIKTVTSRILSKIREMPIESLESWKTAFEVFTLVLLAATFLASWAVWSLSRGVNKLQAERLRQFEIQLTDANIRLAIQQERAAKAETELELVKKKQEPRGIPSEQFIATLKKAPPGKAVVEYVAGFPETQEFATNLSMHLRMANWDVPNGPVGTNPKTVSAGVLIVPRNIKDLEPSSFANPSTTVGALAKALGDLGFLAGGGGVDSNLPEGTIRIIVGPRL
jgi:hypothetical protein